MNKCKKSRLWLVRNLLSRFAALFLLAALSAPNATLAAASDCPTKFSLLEGGENNPKPGEFGSFAPALKQAGIAEAKLSEKKLREAFQDSWLWPQTIDRLTIYRGKVYDTKAFQAEALNLAHDRQSTTDLAFLEIKDGKWLGHTSGGGAPLREELRAQGGKAILYPLSYQQVQELPLDKLTPLVSQALLADCPITPDGKSKAAILKALDFCVVNAYTTTRFYVNKQLWTEKFSELNGEDWAYVRALDQTLARIPNEKPQVVYRGTKANLVKIPANKGSLFELKSFTSTSPNKESAAGFLSGEDDLLMVIHAEHAKKISAYSGAAGEDEFLLPRGTWVRFDKLETKKIKIFNEESGEEEERLVKFLHLTEVPAPSSPAKPK